MDASGYTLKEPDGEDLYVFYRPFSNQRWGLAFSCPENKILGAYYRLQTIALIAMAIVLLLLLFICRKVIDRNLKGVDYQLARCCQPIYGDKVFGFVTVSGGIKIHREDCPNAPELKKRFGYRVVRARWSGKGGSQYAITLRVIGNDDIGIVNNLTSIISKDEKLVLRSINIDSHDGLFSGNLEIMIDDNSRLESLIRKLRTVKGVKQVSRL